MPTADSRSGKISTRTFYRNYEKVRDALLAHLLAQNTQVSKRVLFDKSRKILNRILFLCFSEDYNLLTQDLFRNILRSENHLINKGGKRCWDELKSLFRSVEEGFVDTTISKLFQKDTDLDQLIILNHIFPTLEAITDYDFALDLDVSVFAHIFEQSIHDMEKMTDKNDNLQQGKRKNDGIFYTSSGITKLLIQETLLNWIDDWKNALYESAIGTEKDAEFNDKLLQRLKSIKILDPAAGSGAFLTMAYEMLRDELYKYSEYPERYDLSHNLFGVDLNDKSLDLAKLSLWVKAAKNNDEWPSHRDHLKTGNALIDQSDISEQAFDWHREFPQIMDNGGFDIIIGNPPYVFARNKGFTKNEKKYFNSHYALTDYQINTYILFIERSFQLLKEGGWFGFIVPNNLLTIDSCRKIRRFLLKHTGNLKIINNHNRMFEQADVDTCLLIFQKTNPTTVKLGEYIKNEFKIVAEVEPEELLDEQSIINYSLMKDRRLHEVMNKIETEKLNLGSVAAVRSGLVAYEVGRGAPEQTKAMKENRIYHSDSQVDDTYWMYLEGRGVCRFSIDWRGSWLKYGSNLAARRNEEIFTKPRILVRQIPSKSKYAIHAVYTEKEILNDRNSNNIIDFQIDPLFVLGVLNSKVITFWFIHKFDKFQRKTFPQFKVKDLKMFPVPNVSEAEIERISKAAGHMLDIQRLKSKAGEQVDELLQEEKQLNELLDRCAADAFGLSDGDVQLIDASLKEFLQ
ncbi:Eco57I restriction-modification methylase domain-containing protein [Lentibacillus jeotgali]|uniref:Eco57I restriction-modification methylase domain-containing protein n=1 Tax=Lentibacillus jeotgali TaxID=558169 RepID=UPI00026268A0|nr:TaqI-like C-terminal specificity domain-containing protein [Lentibacillus jeotgali]